MEATQVVELYSTWSDTSNILNCVLSYPACTKDVIIEVERNKIGLQSRHFSNTFTLTELDLHPETCRGLTCERRGEVHFSVNAKQAESSYDTTSNERLQNSETIHVVPSQLKLSQNDLVDKIEMLQNKWYCMTCQQKLLADRCILTKVLPLPSENWSDFADMWFCHRHEGDEPVIKNQRFLPKAGECFVGETYMLISSKHVQIGAIKVSKDGSLTCSRCGNQLGLGVDSDGLSNGEVYKFFIHTIRLEHLAPDSAIRRPNFSRDQAEVFFSRLLLEQCQLYTSFRFIVETSLTNGFKGSGQTNTVSTCLVWLLDSDVTVYKSGKVDSSCLEQPLQKDHIVKVLFKCLLASSTDKRPTDYVTKSVISLWKKDNTVHGFTLPQPVFLQFIQILVENCKLLTPSQRYLNGFHETSFTANHSFESANVHLYGQRPGSCLVSYISKDHKTVK